MFSGPQSPSGADRIHGSKRRRRRITSGMFLREERESAMSQFQAFLAFARFFARIPPSAWDAIIPHGPRVARGTRALFGDFESIALNPQPLPPREFVAVAVADAHLSEI